MFPLKERRLIRGCQAHIDAGLSCATDYRAKYVSLYAPFDGKLHAPYPEGGQGGKWLCLLRDNGDHIEFAHLDSRSAIRDVKEGEEIGITGNTGKLTSSPNLHVQILDKKGRRLDPESYDWALDASNEMNITIDKLNQIYQELLFRNPDPGAEGYLGMEESFVRQKIGESFERKDLIALVEAARKIIALSL